MYIKSKNLTLQPIQEKDLDTLAELLTDAQVKQTYMLPDFDKQADALPLAGRIKAMSEDENRYVAGIYLGAQLLGILNETERLNDEIEVGYALLPRFHSRGYCTEALSVTIDFLLAQGFSQVIAGAFEENKASIRVMQKSGMQLLEREDMIEYRGKNHRCVYYGKAREKV